VQITSRDIMKLFISWPHCEERYRIGQFWLAAELDCVDRLSTKLLCLSHFCSAFSQHSYVHCNAGALFATDK
jgi:hypothetical protein